MFTMGSSSTAPLPVSAAIDRSVITTGVEARCTYVETYWLGQLGPSCVRAARPLVAWLEAEPAGFEGSLAALAARSVSRPASAVTHPSCARWPRLVPFHLANINHTFAIRRRFPPLSAPPESRGYRIAWQHTRSRTALLAQA